MKIKKLTLSSGDYPEALREIPGKPKQLYHLGAPLNQLLKRPRVAIVGTRRVSAYGDMVTTDMAGKLAEQGLVIISGLAFGIDSLAHQAALDAGGLCIAVLPSPLNNIVPVYNRPLAERILEQGGALISEYAPGEPAMKQNFIARNRLMSGLAQVVLITEAGEKSGAEHTFKFAAEQGRTVLSVPGNINQPGSFGTNNYLKSGALVATSYKDVLNALDLTDHSTPASQVRGRNRHEQAVLNVILEGVTQGEIILEKSGLNVIQFNQVLTMLEIGGKIRPLGGNQWALH